MQGPVASLLGAGECLHLHHGPIDLIIGADGCSLRALKQAFEAAVARFQTLLDDLVVDLVQHRRQLFPDTPMPRDPVARRMYQAALPFCGQEFVTPMIAVAGAVADVVLAAMLAATPLDRAYVNNGGDIALHLSGDATFRVAMAGADGSDLGRIGFGAADGIGGVATSGAKGRSHSLGIADSVTVLAKTAAKADAAATLIANAVDLPDRPGIERQPANSLQPDSDLQDRLVVTCVPQLTLAEGAAALAAGRDKASVMLDAGLIDGAALFLQGQNATVGRCFHRTQNSAELADV
jgi:uncharacterized protein